METMNSKIQEYQRIYTWVEGILNQNWNIIALNNEYSNVDILLETINSQTQEYRSIYTEDRIYRLKHKIIKVCIFS